MAAKIDSVELYRQFAGLKVVTRTQTNGLLLLDSPKKRTGELTNVVNVMLEGTMEVYTTTPVVTRSGHVLLPWWIGDMPNVGQSRLGEIRMYGDGRTTSSGVIRQDYSDRPFPATLEAAVFQVFDIPGYPTLRNLFPVIIRGDVQEIPPFSTVAACKGAPLVDDEHNVWGMIGGRTLTLVGSA